MNSRLVFRFQRIPFLELQNEHIDDIPQPLIRQVNFQITATATQTRSYLTIIIVFNSFVALALKGAWACRDQKLVLVRSMNST